MKIARFIAKNIGEVSRGIETRNITKDNVISIETVSDSIIVYYFLEEVKGGKR